MTSLTSLRIPVLLLAGLIAVRDRPATATPGIVRIVPSGTARGTTVDVRFHGRDLAEPQEVFFEDGQIEVVALKGLDPQTLTATLRVPADCPTGPHRLRIRTKTGLSELRTFRVGLFPHEPEHEPNNVVAESVTLPRTITGVITSEDVDAFKVSLPAGGRIAVAVDALRLDQQMFDPHIEVVDARGFVVAACDDHPLLAQDAMLAATVPDAGDSIVRIRESAYGGNEHSGYLLHMGDFPVSFVAWPPGGGPGAEMEVEWIGDPAGSFRERVTLPASAGIDGLAEIHPSRDGSVSPVPVPLRLSSLSATREEEPNDDPRAATRATAPAALVGRLDKEDDVDWFRIEAPKGTQWHVRSWGRRIGSPIDLVVNAYRDTDKRERLTGNDDSEGPDSTLQVTVPEEGSFLIRINDHQKRGGPEFIYWLEAELAAPEAHVSVPVGRPNSQERLVAVVPRGNRTAVLLNASRAGFRDALRVGFTDIPDGVSVTVPDAAGNAPATLAVFEAAAEATPTTVMAGVRVTAVDDGRTLGGLRQKTDLVFGQGNAVFRAVRTDRLPVAVVEAAPFRIELEPPAVPIVRRGSLELRVKVERLDGFDGRVRVFFPFRPPGIGAATSIDIRDGKTEGTYLLNAYPDAPLGEWQVAVTATALSKANPRGDGEMLVASRLVTLRVTEPLVELAAEPVNVEQGKEATILWRVTKPGDFAGMATVRLLGLPARTEAPEVEFAADATEIAFPVTVAAGAPVGQHKNVFCEFRVPQGEHVSVHTSPPTTLRIDPPLPPEEKAP
jgi:hypothetical protein